MKQSFLLYADAYDSIRLLSLEQKGQILDAIFTYQRGEELPALDPVVAMAFSFIRRMFDRDNAKYAGKCEKARASIRKRWDTNVYERKNTDTNHTDNDTVPVPDPVPDTVPENIKRTPPPPSGEFTPSFLEFWSAYPVQKGKAAAFRAWKSIPRKHPGVKPPQIISAIQAQVESDHFRGTDGNSFIPHPTTWLNQGRWDDTIKSAAWEPPKLSIEERLKIAQGGTQ